MNGNVTIIDNKGNAILAEGISYINVPTINKKYLFYTLNEIVQNNLTKVYIAEVSDSIGTTNVINDQEWDYLKKIIEKIVQGTIETEIQNIPMTSGSFNVGEQRKLGLNDKVKEALKNRQLMMSNGNNDVTKSEISATPQPNSSFFYIEQPSQLTEEGNQINQENASTENINIFDNPMTPVNYDQTQIQQSTENISDSKIKNENSVILDGQQQVVPEEYAVDISEFDSSQNQIVSESVMPEEQIQVIEETKMDTLIPEVSFDKSVVEKTVTKEEALHALEVLNIYFQNTRELPSTLIQSQNSVVEQEVNTSITDATSETQIITDNTNNNQTMYINTDANSLSSESKDSQIVDTIQIIDDVQEASLQKNSQYENARFENPQQIIQTVENSQVFNASETPNQDLPPLLEPVEEFVSDFNTQKETNDEYVATGTGASVQIDTSTQDIVPLPVIMPDGFEQAKSINANNGMGPASLNVEGGPTLGLQNVA